MALKLFFATYFLIFSAIAVVGKPLLMWKFPVFCTLVANIIIIAKSFQTKLNSKIYEPKNPCTITLNKILIKNNESSEICCVTSCLHHHLFII